MISLRKIQLMAVFAILGGAQAFVSGQLTHATRPDTQSKTPGPLDRPVLNPATLNPKSSSSLGLFGGIEGPAKELATSLLRYEGNVPLIEAFGLNAVLFTALLSKLKKMLTPTGIAHSLALGTLLWNTLGWRGWTLCVAYFFLGQAVTKVRFADKERRGIAESRGGRRGPENVWGSALTALICAACAAQGESFLGLSSELFQLGYVSALATKLADTFASEIGKAFGKTTFLITTLERVSPGTEGAVSAEGTAASVVGGLLLALYGWQVNLIATPAGVILATVAAFLATNVESLIGATLQEADGYEWMTNEVVNFINTLVGATFAIVGGKVLLGMS